MPILNNIERKKLEQEYEKLEALIRERQLFEAREASQDRALPEENLTTLNFPNAQGWTLLQIAMKLGDIDKINKLLTESKGDALFTFKNRNPNPMTLAFRYGNPALIDKIIAHPETKGKIPLLIKLISTTEPENIDKPDMREHYRKLINILIINPIKSALNPQEKTTFFKPISIPLSLPLDLSNRSYLDYAAETGNIEFLKIFFNKNPHREWSNLDFLDLRNPLISAIENCQYEALACLLEKIPADLRANQGTIFNEEFFISALHIAAKIGDWKSAKLLIKAGANINQQDRFGKTPLYYALENKHETFAKKLLQKKPVLNTYTITGETIFHAAHNCSADLKDLLKNTIKDASLVHQPNIFGKTPENFNNAEQGIGQDKLIVQFIYYLELNYRSKDYLSEQGYCNGLVFLWHYYQSHGKLHIFKAILQTIIAWDRTKESLDKPLTEPLDKIFDPPRSLSQLFEYFINRLTWHQHPDELKQETRIEPRDRKSQFVKENINYIIKPIELSNIKDSQKKEYHTLLSRLPANTHIEGGGDGHVVGYVIADNHDFLYFDPNLDNFIETPFTPQQLTHLEADTKNKALQGSTVADRYIISVYRFDNEPFDSASYCYFSEEELPNSVEDAKNYIKESPNELSHLHVAAFTHSAKNTERLLKENFCDINSKDKHGYTPFDIAVHTGDREFCRLFLNNKFIQLENAKAACIAYKNNDMPILIGIINHPKAINLKSLFEDAIKKDDAKLIQILLKRKKVNDADIAEKFLEEQSENTISNPPKYKKILEDYYQTINKAALIKNLCLNEKYNMALEILKKEKNIIHSLSFDFKFAIEFINVFFPSDELSDYTKKIFYQKIFADIQADIMTPIENHTGLTLLHGFCSQNALTAVEIMIPYCRQKINQPDSEGNTALHIAVLHNADITLIELLIKDGGADLTIENKDKKTALVIAQELNLDTEILDLLRPKNVYQMSNK